MAYHNEQGQVTIDAAAANEDISKIRQALSKLEESQRSIQLLGRSASGMHGQTGAAIVDQCKRLDKQVNDLKEQLNKSIVYIQKTVQKYKEEDRALANKFRSGGGV